jgi:beta-glucosidase
MDPTGPALPRGFTLGVATSAYQIEGAVAEDGRTPSVWDTFCAAPGTIADGTTGEVACDHYHRWADDVALMSELGVHAYRFSVSWPRVVPADGGTNPLGLDFYDRLTDALLARDIAPVVNLFHWDLPQWAQDAGGWLSRDTASRFAEYAAVVAGRLGDRVALWSTMNEAFEHCMLGHLTGEHAPGLTLALGQAMTAAHHLLLGHGLAVPAIRAHSAAPVMLINSYAPARPASDDPADAAAAALYDLVQNRLFTDPVLLGRYPDELAELSPPVRDGDLDAISAPLDALGVNYYTINAVRAADGAVPLEVVPLPGRLLTAFDWAVVPEGLTETLTRLCDRYGTALPPLYVTENGCAYDDVPTGDGTCADPERVDFLAAHLRATRKAIDAGADVRGYFVWSLLDNFEWAQGRTKRFGLVHVDYATQQRTPKSSYTWLHDLIRRQSNLDG